MSIPRWKEFERLVYEMQKSFAEPTAIVAPNDHIDGHDSKTSRQIDISIRSHIANHEVLIVIDCKDYKDPVDVKEVGEFSSVVKDVRANKGVMVASHGFTKAAVEMARSHGISTLTFVDTENIDWKSFVTIPVLLERTSVDGVSIRFQSVGNYPWVIPVANPLELDIYDIQGIRLGKVRDSVARKWNNCEVEHKPGIQEVLLGDDLLVDSHGDKVHTAIRAFLRTRITYYLGPLPVKVSGFMDEQTGGLSTRQLTTDFIEPSKIERGEVEGWTQIQTPEELSVRVMFKMGYSDLLPVSE
jgi:hypothetical protein